MLEKVIETYTVAQIRAAEAAAMASLPDGELMRRAATGLTLACVDQLGGSVRASRIVALVGGGDNGGDTLWAATLLARRGGRVTAVTCGGEQPDWMCRGFIAAGGRIQDHRDPDSDSEVLSADLILDGLVGIGASGPLRPGSVARHFAELLSSPKCQDSQDRPQIIAVDLPSGIDPTSGQVPGPAVRADLTVTFGARKTGTVAMPAAEYVGRLECVDIGLGPFLSAQGEPDAVLLTDADVAAELPRPGMADHKYTRGVVGIRAGSDQYPGAAVLTVGGALRAGAGLVRYSGPDSVRQLVLGRFPETVCSPSINDPGRVQSRVIGPGIGIGSHIRELLADALHQPIPVVLDAGALTETASLLAEATTPVVMTPHAGELARLLEIDRARVEAEPLAHARAAAGLFGATVLLKGARTLVARAGRPTIINTTGTPWLATAGSGDVLAGMIGALLAGGVEPQRAAAAAAFLHGKAAEMLSLVVRDAPIVTTDLLASIPGAMSAVHREAKQ